MIFSDIYVGCKLTGPAEVFFAEICVRTSDFLQVLNLDIP